VLLLLLRHSLAEPPHPFLQRGARTAGRTEWSLEQKARTGEDEGGDGAVGGLEADAGAAHGARDGDDRLLLPNDPVVQFILHLDQPCALVRRHLKLTTQEV